MSVILSSINKQTASIESLSLPQGYALASGGGTGGNLTVEKGKLAYNLTDNRVYVCQNAAWIDLSSAENVTLAAVGAVANANGASLVGQVLNLQPASASFPGVVTAGAQTFGGTKTFSAIVSPGTNYSAIAPVAAVDVNGIVVDSVLNQISLEFADVTRPGIVSIAAQTFNGIKSFDDGIIVSPTVSVGVVNTLTQQYHAGYTIATTGGGSNVGFPIIIQRTDAMGFISFGTSNSIVAANSIITSTVPLDVEFRPGGNRTGLMACINNGAYTVGCFKIDSAGIITMGKGMTTDSALVAFDAGTLQILDCSAVYSFS